MTQLPNQSWYGPVLGPLELTLPAGASIVRLRTQSVPGGAPAGQYWYEGRVGDYPATIWDTSGFAFTKLGSGIGQLEAGEWTNIGKSFSSEETRPMVSGFGLLDNYPNPFNAITTFRIELPVASWVKLEIYNGCGKSVGAVFEGWRPAGYREVTFDGSELSSGLYFAKLSAAGCGQVQKMVLLK
jgi:hypothetical protein